MTKIVGDTGCPSTKEVSSKHADKDESKVLGDPSLNKLPIKRNAFSELMASKPSKTLKTTTSTQNATATEASSESTKPQFYTRNSNRPPGDPRLGLLEYIQNPSSFPPSTVLRITPDTVLIRDLYPKATIHLLLLPRSTAHYNLHPHDAFADPAFLDLMKSEAASAAQLAASELSRLIAPHSSSSRARNEAMEQETPPLELPAGRDFHKDLKIGIHTHPSMSHLHIHIISRDMHSSSLKHRKHYNSFNTDFFIPLADYPLAEGDQRLDTSHQNANLKRDFECWRCGAQFGNKFTKLKDHLELEYTQWRAE